MKAVSDTFTVAELLGRIEAAIASTVPGPVWVRGEVTGFRRTAAGAAFFRLADHETERSALDISARGKVMLDVDRSLTAAGIGGLRDGVEVRIRGTLGIDAARSVVRLSLLEVDPAFTAGRLAVDRKEVLRRLAADGSLASNGRLSLPLVPLRVGLVTSRGSAAHADFLDHLRQSGYRFAVRTAHASMQGQGAVGGIVRALQRLADAKVDVIAIVRGGGSRLDLTAFDTEEVSRAVAAMPVPVLAGIGHETDRSVVDEAVAVSVKTPTAAAGWLADRVSEYSTRIETARRLIADEARDACARANRRLDHSAALLGGVRATIGRRHDGLASMATGIAEDARRVMARQGESLESIEQMLGAYGVEATLGRGFALVVDERGTVVRSVKSIAAGDRLSVRLDDGAAVVTVEEINA